MRGKPTRKTHHARPRTIRPRVGEGQQQADASVMQVTATKRKCVLVVEDNATIGGLMVALLREEGYRALRAWDGAEAIKMARDRKPDLIMLDLSLPYPDGLPVLRELKAHPETKDAPIIVVSGNLLQLAPG